MMTESNSLLISFINKFFTYSPAENQNVFFGTNSLKREGHCHCEHSIIEIWEITCKADVKRNWIQAGLKFNLTEQCHFEGLTVFA